MTTFDTIITNMPVGLDGTIIRVLESCQGRKKAISRYQLLARVRQAGLIDTHERQLREMIKQLRRRGWLIGSAPGEDGGYWMIASREEFDEFLREEFEAKIIDMSETKRAMQKEAERQWGWNLQPSLL